MKSWLTTTDHKRIGQLYFWTALGFFLIGGLEALVIRAQLARPEGIGVSAEDAASAAAHGALKAADKVGSTAVETVRHAVTQTISGVKVVLKEPFKGKEKK